jgi:hypothetical protein
MPGLVSVSCISLGAPPKSETAGGAQSSELSPGEESVVHPARIRGATAGAAPANVTTAGAAMVANAKRCVVL